MSQMTEAPEGPVTIMFTDIEGSTALRTSLGDAETDSLLRRHDELIRAEIEAHKGHDQRAALGDGFLAVFPSTRRAVACAINIQRALDAFNRARSAAPLKVRIGLNTGEVALENSQLSGEAVHAAARVCAIGEGGQILVSDVTRQLAGTIPDVTFRDAGEHELKGFPHPWRLWDVIWVRETTAAPEQVFVGREAELGTLRNKLTSSLDGHGGLVLVGGEPGVGKTTLVKQLIQEAERRGALAIFGRCYESEGSVPYSPFIEMLEQAFTIIPPDIVREDMGEDAPEIARMVPELRRRFSDIPPALDLPPEQQRRYFFNALAAFISRASARFPLLLIMDDVHWADEPTLLLIEHMASLMSKLRILGIGTYRDVELEVSRPLAASIERMLRARTLERFSLHRFDRDGVATMVEALATKPAPPAIVDAIYSETEGNPFFVEEVFRHLTEEGKVFDESGEFRTDLTVDELDVPESVRLVVGRRLRRLGTQPQPRDPSFSAPGRAFPFSLLEDLTDVESHTLLDIVDEAEAARVIVPEERDGQVHYSFAHELIRQTLLASLSIIRRQRLHLAVADAIQRLDVRAIDERPAEIAVHLMQAGSAAESGRLLEFLERSARRALESAAFEEAVRALDDALAAAEEKDLVRRADLLQLRGRAARGLGRFEDCLKSWTTARDLYEQLGDVRAAGGLTWEIAYLQIWLARFDEAFASFARGVEVLGEEKAPERVMINAGITALLGIAGMHDLAKEHNEVARSLAEELGDTRGRGAAEWSWCVAQWCNAMVPEASEAGRNATALFREVGDVWTLVDSLSWLSYPLVYEGKAAEALSAAEEAHELALKIGHIGGEALARRGITLSRLLLEPDLDAFEEGSRKDLELLGAINSPWVSQSHVFLSFAHQSRGDLDQAIAEADEAIRLEPLSAFSGIGWSAKIVALALARDTVSCRRMLAEPMPDPAPAGEPSPVGSYFGLFARAIAAAFIGSADDARRLYPILAERLSVTMYGFFDLQISERIAGMVAATAEQWEDAERHFVEAARIAREAPNRWDAPHVEYWHGKMLLDRGRPEDREAGIAKVKAARAEYERRGMPVHLKMADDLLRT